MQKQIIKFKKFQKAATIEVASKSGQIKIRLGFGYSFDITKDKDGKELPEKKTIRRLLDGWAIGDDGEAYRTVEDGECRNHITPIRMIEFVTVVGDKEIKNTMLDTGYSNKTASEIKALAESIELYRFGN